MLRRLGRVAIPLLVGFLVLPATPVAGEPTSPSPPGVRNGAPTQIVMSGTGPGQGVTGFVPDGTFPFDPIVEGYPPSDPTTGFVSQNEGFAGIIHGNPPGGGAPTLAMYCIDLHTLTYPGIGYVLGTWDASNVPNVDYVGRLLNEYYPATNEPAGLTDVNQKAAAVQAAVWFFTDGYVLSTSSPLRAAVVQIVNHIISEGPLPAPAPPSLTISPATASAPAGSIIGPFTVTSSAGSAKVNVTGGSMWSDASATTPIANGATVPSGQKIWLTSTGPTTAVLQATAVATVPRGNVYLYDGFSPGVNDAQKLILAEDATLSTTVTSTAEFLAPGSLKVTKTIGGPAAGQQGQIVIHTVCDGVAQTPDLVIPAGATGAHSQTYENIPAGSVCTVIEKSDGSSSTVEVVVTGDGQQVTIPPGGSASADVSDTYSLAPGSLVVRKTIAGPGAGQQGQIVIHTVCNNTPLSPDFVIPAGTPTGDKTMQYDNIPAGSNCTVTETVDGHSSTVSVVVEGSGQTVAVPAGDIVEADISDAYGLLPGQLLVTKSITGTEAGHQGDVVIHTVCGGVAQSPDLVIPAGTPAGDASQLYSPIAAGTACTTTETTDGHTSTVSVVIKGSPATTTIPPGGAGAAHITDTYGPADGSLVVVKNIAGTQAGHQGPVTIHVVCNGIALSPDLVIPAGTPAGSLTHDFDNVPAGSTCTVTETADGATSTVTVTVTGNNQQVTVPAGKEVTVSLIDVYEATLGSLDTIKTIAGSAAGQQGPIAILVDCGGALNTFVFPIPAGAAAGPVSRFFDGLPAGSTCTITEVVDGHSDTASVAAQGSGQKAVVPAAATVTVNLTNTFTGTAPVTPITQVTVPVTG